MNVRSRIGTIVAIVVLGVAGVLGLSACAPGAAAAAAMSPEQTALTALGFSDGDVTAATVPASPSPDVTKAGGGHPRLRRLALRRRLRRNVEHGQITVETKQGDKTIAVQRGTVTAVTATTITVKSADGFTLTWAFADKILVIDHGTKSPPSALMSGETVGVAGVQDGTTATARLLVVPKT